METARLTPDQKTIRDQRERIDELEEELRQMKEQTTLVQLLPHEWRMEPALQKILFALYRAPCGFVSRERLFQLSDCSGDDASNIISTQVCRLRKRLNPYGVEVRTRWGSGYELTAASKVIIKAALEQRASA